MHGPRKWFMRISSEAWAEGCVSYKCSFVSKLEGQKALDVCVCPDEFV